MRHRPSVTDVARQASVSVGTVSNVLNRPHRVAPRTLQRVEQVINELGFVPNASARQLRAGVIESVGAILLDIGNPFFTAIARGIEDRLAQQGLALLVSSSDEDHGREVHLAQLYEQHTVRGVLVTPASSDVSELEAIRDRGTPIVLMDASNDATFPSVTVDDVLGARLAVEHLLSLGHRRIGFLNGSVNIRQCANRRIGAHAAVINAGLDPHHVLTEVTLSSLQADGGDRATMALLSSSLDQRQTAIFCVNDLVALGSMRALLRCGLRVPQDVAVVGYDDIGVANLLMVPLTTVRQPTQEIGWAAADLLVTASDPRSRMTQHVRFEPELVVRASSDPRC